MDPGFRRGSEGFVFHSCQSPSLTTSRDRPLAQTLRWLHRCEDALLALALGLLVLLACGQIVARLVFDAGGVWVEPSMRLVILWITMLGALAATRERRHVAIDLLPRLLPPVPRRLAWAFGQLFAGGLCALLAWGAWALVSLEREGGGVAFANLPVWVSLLILPAGFALMALRFLLTAWQPPPVDAHDA